ncbi:carbonic anhydrase [Paracoccus siganidrum]|uniref:Carbonic anhydrase n=1 Tax=Paracoccus siganidrum TaxID=1276757 RepID=A0A418ZZV0_9RHOB|nr:carbonic anhydrase [Paracoccus siganidrum]RJL06064.1 carbonic anhydrase [Paracoccus siganidrum]RMC36969.1 carbonic anhydrase [Paracoccus siganidrum]
MQNVRPLPQYLVGRYHGWKATSYAENSAWYRRLAEDGQRPRAMVISCCDSRVHVTSIFGADSGEFFIHRNIANLVPPYAPDGLQHGTSAAVEYAVTALHVAHLIVVGHTSCGGVAGCHAMCSGRAPELEEKSSFVGRWMDILRPGYERVKDLPEDQQVGALEREAVMVSIENLMTFPFVKTAVESGELSLHGIVHDIKNGTLMQAEDGGRRWAEI